MQYISFSFIVCLLFASIIRIGSSPSIILEVEHLEHQCNGVRSIRTSFVPPPGYVEKLGKEKPSKDDLSAETSLLKDSNSSFKSIPMVSELVKLKDSINPMCKMEFKNRLSHPQPKILDSTEAIFNPSLLGKFCGHELCPQNESDFGCKQTSKCLCYLKATSELESMKEIESGSKVHIFWSGIPTSQVVKRAVYFFQKTQRPTLSLIVWYHSENMAHLKQLKKFVGTKEEEEEEKENSLGCDLLDRSRQVHVCHIDIEIMKTLSQNTSFEGYYPVMRSSKNNVEHYPRPLSDMIRFLLLDKFGGLYMDADSILLRDLTPILTSPDLDCFSSFWGVQGFMNTGAVLRLRRGSEHAIALIKGLVNAAKRGEDGDLLINAFHPKAVTKVAKKLNLFPYHFKPLSLAFFEPAWCQPTFSDYAFPNMSSLHNQDHVPVEALHRLKNSGAFALHYHRAAESEAGKRIPWLDSLI